MKYIFGITIPLFILDQVTKYLILQRFPKPPGFNEPIEVIPDFFWLTRVHNTGMAFGLLNGNPYANYIFGVIGLIALTIIVVLWRKNTFPDPLTKVAVALLVSGIFGNLTDRIIPGRGYVVDFLDFKLPLWHLIDESGHFPSFNVADSCICIAAGLMVFSAIQGIREEAAEKKAKAA
ncbi:MAG: signal peptidase II [Verrucomicrobiales bacterium]|nr:signal peptidase II [Verrucomicrobiales bacterium]